jgi:hypothetical protein
LPAISHIACNAKAEPASQQAEKNIFSFLDWLADRNIHAKFRPAQLFTVSFAFQRLAKWTATHHRVILAPE